MTSTGELVGIACALGLVSGCSGGSVASSGGSGETTGASSGSAGAAPIILNPKQGLHVDAGAGGGFGPIALTAAAGEGELFFSQEYTSGFNYLLQHLSPSGSAVGVTVQVATGTPTAPPVVAVASTGTEISCCWEDWGRLDPLSPTAGEVTRCNSVPLRGVATDGAMDGGFSDLGSKPSLAQGTQTTALAYAQADDAWVSETILYYGSRIRPTLIAPYVVTGFQMAPLGDGYALVISDGGALDLSIQAYRLANDGGLAPVPGGGSTGSFAVATNAIPALPAVTAVLVHQGSNVVANLLGAAPTSPIDINSAGEQPLDPLAAVGCNASTFGLAYALDGGDLAVREMSIEGAITGSGTIAAALGGNITSVALAAVDGGMLIAAGTATDIAVYSAPCQ